MPGLIQTYKLLLSELGKSEGRDQDAKLNLRQEPQIIDFFFFWPHRTVCGILVPWPGIEPGPQAVKGAEP